MGFGATELLGLASKAGLIDAAVLACDGAGTVIVKDPAQGCKEKNCFRFSDPIKGILKVSDEITRILEVD